MSITPVTTPSNARRRLRSVLREHSELLRALEEVGGVSVFGGAARDLFTATPQKLRRDLDLVVEGDPDELAAVCARYGAVRNRFDGFRIYSDMRPFDVWALSNTWAFRQKLVATTSLSALCDTTYFSSDSIVFELRTGRFHHRDAYFADIERRRLDLVLRDNPNPLGAILRTLTFSTLQGFALSRMLATHTSRVISELSTTEASKLESKAKSTPSGRYLQEFRQRVESYLVTSSAEDFQFSSREQLNLPF